MKTIWWEDLVSAYAPETPPHCSGCGCFVRHANVATHSDRHEAYCDHCEDWCFVSYERA